jgi:hypothetical protein
MKYLKGQGKDKVLIDQFIEKNYLQHSSIILKSPNDNELQSSQHLFMN